MIDPKRAIELLQGKVYGPDSHDAMDLGALAIEAMEARVLKSEAHSGKNIDAAHHAEVAYLAAAHPEKKE